MKKLIFALGLLFLFSSNADAATKYARAGGGNWSADATWSTTSGGGADTTKCVVTDDCKLDASSGNVTVDVASAALSLVATGYTGTLTLGANLTVSGNLTLVSGMTFTPSTYQVILNGTGTVTSAGKAFYKARLGASGTTLTLADDMTVNNTLTFDEAWASGTTINGYTIKAKGDIDRSAASLNHNVNGTTTLSIEGSGTQNVLIHCYIAGLAYNVTFKLPIVINSTGTVVFTSGGTSTLGGDFTYTAGTVTTTGSNIIINNMGTARNWSSGSIAWNNVRFENNTGTTTLGSDLNVSGTLDFGNNWVTMTLNGYSINASGNVQRNSDIGTLYGNIEGTTVLTLTGSASQSFAVPGYNTSIGLKLSVTVNKSGGTLTLTGTNNYGNGTWTYTAGTVDAGTGTSVLYIIGAATLNTNGMSWYDIIQGANITLGSDLDFSHNFTRTAGAVSGAYYLSPTGATTHVIDGTNTISGFDCATGETCSFDDADIFTITNGKGNGTWQSDDATNTVDIDFTAETIAYGEGIRVDSAGGVAVTTVGSITACVNWSDASSPVTTAYTWVG